MIPGSGATVKKQPVGDSLWSSVEVLCHFQGTNGQATNIRDEKGHTTTAVGNAQYSTSQIKFQDTSLFVNGTSSNHISVAGVSAPGTGQYTLESWVYIPSTTGTVRICNDSTNGKAICIQLSTNTAGSRGFQVFQNGTNKADAGTSTFVAANSWLYVAVNRGTDNFVHFKINGNLMASFTDAANISTLGSDWFIGDGQCFLRDFRYTLADRYGTSVPIPTTPWPNS